MRRSGTTILFDLFWADRRFRCWYEPLSRARSSLGGGSKARSADYAAPVRKLRRRLVRQGLTADSQDFNWGAPRDPAIEFQPGWPEHVQGYLRAMTAKRGPSFVKFTRASHHVAELASIRPDAFFVHLVRDPRSVVTSHLLPSMEHTKTAAREESFFTRPDDFNRWSVEIQARWLAESSERYAFLKTEPAFVRCLAVWKEMYVKTRDDAETHFGDRYLLVWHDDLARRPSDTLDSLYQHWGMTPKERQREWATRSLRDPTPWHDAENPAWEAALERLEIQPLIDEAVSKSVTPR